LVGFNSSLPSNVFKFVNRRRVGSNLQEGSLLGVGPVQEVLGNNQEADPRVQEGLVMAGNLRVVQEEDPFLVTAGNWREDLVPEEDPFLVLVGNLKDLGEDDLPLDRPWVLPLIHPWALPRVLERR
jgi:hypothetical protein